MVVKKHIVDLNKLREKSESMTEYSDRMYQENKDEFGKLKPSELREKAEHKMIDPVI